MKNLFASLFILIAPHVSAQLLGTLPITAAPVSTDYAVISTPSGSKRVLLSDLPSPIGAITGLGTLNYVPKWTPSGIALGNSLIYDNGTNIGIGTTTPLQKFHLVGNAYVNGNLGIGTSSPNNFIQVPGLINFNNTDFNTQIGRQAGNSFTSGSATFMTAIGYQALLSNSNGYSNTAIGAQSLYSTTTGHNITAVGILAASNAINTSSSVFLGENTALALTGGQHLTIIGFNANVTSATQTNSIGLGYNSTITLDNQIVFGQTATPVNRWKVAGIDWVMPAAQGGANTLLRNDGSGNLTWSTLAGAGVVAGTGTTNFIPKWTSSTTQGNSILSDDGTNVIIPLNNYFKGSAASGPVAVLSLNDNAGSLYSGGFGGTEGAIVAGPTTASLYWDVNTGTSRVDVSANAVDIYHGTAVNVVTPQFKLTTGTPGIGKVLTDDGTGNGIAVWTAPTGGSLTVGTTTIASGSSGNVLYNNAGTLGEMTTTGSGTVLALATLPNFVAPILGTPTSGTLTNCTGLPISTGVSGLGTGVATTLGTNLSITGGGTIGLGGFTLTVPATGTAALGTGAATRVSFWSGTNTLSSSANMVTDGTFLTVGTTALVSAPDVAIFSKSQNASVRVMARNDNSGSSAYTSFSAFNGTHSNSAGITSSGATGGGAFGTAHLGYLSSTHSSGLALVANESAADLHFYAGGSAAANEKMTLTDAGLLGIGTTTISARLHVMSTTEQFRIGYDASNYVSLTEGSTGGLTIDCTGSGSGVTFNDKVTLSNPVNLKSYTVATLPAGVVGDVAYVTDATAPTYLSTVVGGGAVVTPVFYDGTNWVAH